MISEMPARDPYSCRSEDGCLRYSPRAGGCTAPHLPATRLHSAGLVWRPRHSYAPFLLKVPSPPTSISFTNPLLVYIVATLMIQRCSVPSLPPQKTTSALPVLSPSPRRQKKLNMIPIGIKPSTLNPKQTQYDTKCAFVMIRIQASPRRPRQYCEPKVL